MRLGIQLGLGGGGALAGEGNLSVPASPTGYIFSAESGFVNGSWDPVDGATHYDIWHSADDEHDFETASLLVTVPAPAVSFHVVANNGQRYNGWITACNGAGSSEPLFMGSVIPIIGNPVLTISSLGPTSFRVSWPAIAGASGYRIIYGEDIDREDNMSGSYVGVPSGQEYYDVPADGIGTPVYLWVQAYDTATESSWMSNQGSAAYNAPAAPSGVSFVSFDHTPSNEKATFSWTDNREYSAVEVWEGALSSGGTFGALNATSIELLAGASGGDSYTFEIYLRNPVTGSLSAAGSVSGNYPATVPGCMDPAANNYNPAANLSDGSCTYG